MPICKKAASIILKKIKEVAENPKQSTLILKLKIMSNKTQSDIKQEEYYMKIMSAISEVVEDEDSEHYIGLEDLQKGDNMTDFIHVISNVVPSMVFNKLTGSSLNYLDFNHTANSLCFQYSEKQQ